MFVTTYVVICDIDDFFYLLWPMGKCYFKKFKVLVIVAVVIVVVVQVVVLVVVLVVV